MLNQKKLFQSTQNTIQLLKESKDLLILLKQEPRTQVSGSKVSEMAKVFKSGLMEPDMKVSFYLKLITITGQWKDNRAHGHGKFVHVDGDIYEGNWINDKANGYGIYIHVNGARYEGSWKDDLQHG